MHLAFAGMALATSDLGGAGEALGQLGGVDVFRGDVAHELRASSAIYRTELAVRRADVEGAAAALQDAEILQSQAPLADPSLQWSLERAMSASQDKDLRRRLRALSDTMERAMDRGSEAARGRPRR